MRGVLSARTPERLQIPLANACTNPVCIMFTKWDTRSQEKMPDSA
jgi:hypothetical protein